jgi:MSHA biogenesis protein MshJ
MNAATTLDRAMLKRKLTPLLAAWERRAKRVDALSLRERAILFLCIAAVLVAVFDSLVLTPLNTKAKSRAEVAALQGNELKQLREQFVQASRGSNDPAAPLLQRLQAAQRERERLDTEIVASQAATAAVANASDGGLPAVLQRLLAQQPGLNLLRLTLLDDAVPRPGEPQLPGLRWQGVEMQIEGDFTLQQRYLQSLERQLPGLQWGELRLRAAAPGQPLRLQAQVFVLRMTP